MTTVVGFVTGAGVGILAALAGTMLWPVKSPDKMGYIGCVPAGYLLIENMMWTRMSSRIDFESGKRCGEDRTTRAAVVDDRWQP